MKIENARIVSTMLGSEDHGLFTCFVTVEGEGWGCGFGGYCLDEWNEAKKKRIGTAYGMEFIKRVLETLEKEQWEHLVGIPVRIKTEGVGGRILAIGHYYKNKWFDPKELAAEFGC